MQQTLARCAQAFEDDKYTKLFYEAVWQNFENYPENVDKLAALLKFTILNGLYITNIMDKAKIVDHIYRLATEENLDALLKSGNHIAINKIRCSMESLRKREKNVIFIHNGLYRNCRMEFCLCSTISTST